MDTDAVGHSAVKRHAPATLRNRAAITEVLKEVLPSSGTVLELASGSGEHIVHFAQAFPDIAFVPSDHDESALSSIIAWTREAGVGNVAPPLTIDCTSSDRWPVAGLNAIICINMIHIAPWEAAIGLFRGGAAVLNQGAPLYLYGPFFEQDVETADSNRAFNSNLKEINGAFGIRWLSEVDNLAKTYGFVREHRVAMPANNLSLIYRKICLQSCKLRS